MVGPWWKVCGASMMLGVPWWGLGGVSPILMMLSSFSAFGRPRVLKAVPRATSRPASGCASLSATEFVNANGELVCPITGGGMAHMGTDDQVAYGDGPCGYVD